MPPAHQRDGGEEVKISIKRLDAGYLHIRGEGICNWSQPPEHEIMDFACIRKHAFPQASDDFIRKAVKAVKKWHYRPSTRRR